MNQSKIRTVLEVGTNVAVLLAAMTVVTFFAVSFFGGKNAQAQKGNPKLPQSKLQAGQVLPRFSGIDYNASPRTLMTMMSTKCKFCIASLPFYKRMMEEQNEKDGLVHFVAAFPNSSEEVIQFVTENQFPIETVAGLMFDDVGLQYTTTLVL